ncbi:hypothetical protein UFOVP244_36 [uncultured Caudovirales phage]|uniref:Uncharacterized protein n=1 Tax=uncultured Caudovirales phage TaxID=2100421 RepID=A0A6J7WXF7_9CAUD|nr:hypothetical protein UFOVP244_36 [uncultured Caudovirales phage]
MNIVSESAEELNNTSTHAALVARVKILLVNTDATLADAVERVCRGPNSGSLMDVLMLIEDDIFFN